MNDQIGENLPELNREFERLIESGNFKSALPKCLHALEVSEKLYGDSSLEYAEVCQNLSIIQRMIGNSSEAMAIASRVYDVRRSILGEDDLLSIESLAEIGMVEYRAMNYSKSELTLLRVEVI
ncbi:MAG TPA: tetratricopeptide repeat protein [Acidobacteriota bacterium]|nr:tetratricopeptide repeat protein [Acidobacteriota bacterium]